MPNYQNFQLKFSIVTPLSLTQFQNYAHFEKKSFDREFMNRSKILYILYEEMKHLLVTNLL